MSYIGNQPTSVAFLTDQFSGTGSQTAFTLSAAPANTASIIVAVSGVLQDPTTYSTSGLTLTFSAAPPSGTGNISVRFLGIPASNIATTAYRTQTEFTATAGQTTFSVPSYTPGFIDVYRNGVLLGSADYTATNGTTVVLAAGATAGDLVETISFFVSSVLNAIPATAGAVTTPYLLDGSVTKAKMAASGAWAPAGTVIQVVNAISTTQVSTTSTSYVDTGLTASITPTSASSKILVIVNQTITPGTSGSNTFAQVRLMRGASQIWFDARVNGIGQYVHTTPSASVLDSPATTSSVTYKTQFATGTGIYAMEAQHADIRYSTITLMEIAG
jgi:hypothetical protein